MNHEYKEWDDNDPQLTTCNKDTKMLIQGSTVPQEVDVGKEIVFTYDVTFKVFLNKLFFSLPELLHLSCTFSHFFILFTPLISLRKVTLNGHLVGIHTSS